MPNEGQVIHRLTKRGWTHGKGRLRCMACEIKRKGEGMAWSDTARTPVGPADVLTPGEAKFLAYADGTRTVQEIAMAMGWSSQGSVRNYLNRLAPRGAKAKPAGGRVIRMTQETKPATAQNVTAMRVPTQEQNRQIFEMLGVVYDTAAGRYRDCESDVTVAEAVGGGCMFGWVADIREKFFGPDGRNEELDKLRNDIAAWRGQIDAAVGKVHDDMAVLRKVQDRADEFSRRVDALVKAAGPRGRVAS